MEQKFKGCKHCKLQFTSFLSAYEAFLQETVDVALPFALLFAVKDEKELTYMRRSAEASVNAWNNLRKKLVDIVDTEKVAELFKAVVNCRFSLQKVRHNRLAEDLEKTMVTTAVQGRIAQDNALESCYSPILQSGPDCTLKFSTENSDSFLHFGSISGSMGVRYYSYCTNVARTIMIEPTSEMENIYEILLAAQTALVEKLKPGTRICDAYAAALDVIRDRKPELLSKIVKSNLGFVKVLFSTSNLLVFFYSFVTGIEFRDPLLLINERCQHLVRPNMTFIVLLGAQNFDNPPKSDADNKTASIFLSDTVLVLEVCAFFTHCKIK